ncbi:ATP-grasp domain-containing protein [Streptomyces poonensis]|uniref:ATP-grasp domain-containing protein n=1 Tax=Streptomyces poonensis TaxID=68255 RepID=A0A918PJN6_9ACTN|nr:hypothetical protein [Streptomyces poonensis]GGZ11804.1 ATP-grasp domain-containing protein [Streptomyces poonensis]GLJ92643.1 ATP-grasp domain-containing protein [Streptomyces poonensis]
MARTAPSRIALVTYDPGADGHKDSDLPVLARAVDETGAVAEVVHWDDPEAEWGAYDLAVIRSTWDYSWRAEEFADWAERCARATRLANPAHIVRWNADKRYLGELADAGVPVVPTRYIAPGDPVELPEDREYVVKPTSGAGARFAARYAAGEREAAVRQIERMHAEKFTAMVQPYLTGIDTTGERALQFYGGRLLHASRKGAVLTPGTPYDADKMPHPDLRVWEPTGAELAVADRALAAVPGGASGLLYARVDLVDGEDGRPCVMELELIEPNLFLWLHPESVRAVAEAIGRAAGV